MHILPYHIDEIFDYRDKNGDLWAGTAQQLYRSAQIIKVAFKNALNNFFTRTSKDEGYTFDDIGWEFVDISLHDQYYLLMGLSFELYLKAVCKKKGSKVFGHKLKVLFQQSGLDKKLFPDDIEEILIHLTECIEWRGRYPTPTEKAKSEINNLRVHDTASTFIDEYMDKIDSIYQTFRQEYYSL